MSPARSPRRANPDNGTRKQGEELEVLAHWQSPDAETDDVASQLIALRRRSVGGSDHARIRASVLNLVAYAPGRGLRERAARVIAELSGRHPSRALLVSPEQGSSFSLSAAVTIFCRPNQDLAICFEQVVLRPRGGNPRNLSTLVIPLLVPHLTTMVWWMPEQLDANDPGLRSLTEFCDRVIVDTRDHGVDALGELVALSRRVGIGDFAWTRLDPWREMAAQFFDGAGSQPFLDGLDEVVITGAREPGTEPTVPELLLLGWLASRLGLQPDRYEDGRIRMVGLGRRTWFEVVAGGRLDEDAARDGRLLSLELRCQRRREWATYRLDRRGDNLAAISEVHGTRISRTARRRELPDGALLGLQLDSPGRDRVFITAVETAQAVANLMSANRSFALEVQA